MIEEEVSDADQRRQVTQRVAVVGAIANLILAVVKITIGWTARSQALLVDGIHSLSDLLTDALVWWAAHHAAEAPDEQHPYGHGRFETAATLGLGALLVLVSGAIIWDTIERIWSPERLWQPQPIALAAAVGSILVNEALYWYTRIAANRIQSDMLRANAWHHRSDAISSVVVLVGVGGVLLGFPWLDAVAALVVGVMVAKIGWDLGWGAMRELVDEALDEERVLEIRRLIEQVDGVRSIHMLRTRRQAHQALADVHIQVDPRLSVSEGHMISIAVENCIKQQIDEMADVTVHVDPEDDETSPPCEGLPLRHEVLARLEQLWADVEGYGDHKQIMLHYLGGQIDIDLLFPLDCYQGADRAHLMKTRLQENLALDPSFRRLSIYYG